jgi:hypothetical protein
MAAIEVTRIKYGWQVIIDVSFPIIRIRWNA